MMVKLTDERRRPRETDAGSGSGPLARAGRLLGEATRAGALAYSRERHLAGLIGIAPEHVGEDSVAATRLIVARLKRALKAERRRARSGHWAYDLNRHIALSQAYVAETAYLKGRAPPVGRRPS